MPKKIILFLIGAVFFYSFHFVFASLSINEIMYDLSGSDSANSKSREWIEIYNPDSSDVSIDASKWRIFDGSANRTINDQVDFSIPSNSYVIFAGDKDTFLADHPGFSGTVYDTGITSLNNTGTTLKILDQDLNTVDSVAYASTQGAAGDGNSLQKISGSWVGGTPTPGIANQASLASGGMASS
ncbi:MAG TPA: lamin tail domain-containing protein, partial [Candidatus Paceibacterota bacterium]|nr:lamin tail domain-containing protein [Candidatus Paceibacterota bacterium]